MAMVEVKVSDGEVCAGARHSELVTDLVTGRGADLVVGSDEGA